MLLVAKNNRLRTFNNYLTLVVVTLSLYIILLPFLPYFQLWISNLTDNTGGVRYGGVLATSVDAGGDLREAPDDNRLVLPSIQLDEHIVVGDDPNNIHLGVAHRPKTSTPDKGGNTVLVGHRFSYDSPAVFYHLDKVAAGDKFAVWWEGTEYVYEVFERVVVGPRAFEIEANTEAPIMTLYTCTPVWTAQNRLVIKANLVNTDVLENRKQETGNRNNSEAKGSELGVRL